MKLTEIAYPLPKFLEKIKRQIAFTAILRLIVFFLLFAILIIGLSDNRFFLLFIPVIGLLFIGLIKRFNFLKDKESFISELLSMEIEQEARKNRKLENFDPGTAFLDKKHPFCNDLDLFGSHSLFQLINHTVSLSGRQLLADSMKKQINQKTAKENYESVEELRKKGEFLRNFESVGRAFIKAEKNKASFYKWLKKNEKWAKGYFFILAIGPIGGILILLAGLFGFIHASWIGLWIITGLLFLSIIHKDLHQASLIWPNYGDIKTFRYWSSMLEKESFKSQKLEQIHLLFKKRNLSKGLRTLEQVSFMVQNRLNLVYLVFNLIFWLDYFLLWQLKNWKKEYGKDISEIEGIFDQWQVFVSLASFSEEAELKGEIIWDKDSIVNALNVQHPLLLPQNSVGNDFFLDQSQKTVLLTGSNMSGKTTFMRTVGINMVLANLGIRPFAGKFICGSFQLYTSMRNSDSLGESVSSFYAELARIRQIIEAAESGKPVFYLMDEILKGTNTKDRIVGSEALIRQLSTSKAKGIISTHDIELSDLEKDLPYLVNHSFHSKIDDREITFDYKLKAGPCPSFNAHKLMELMGIRFD